MTDDFGNREKSQRHFFYFFDGLMPEKLRCLSSINYLPIPYLNYLS